MESAKERKERLKRLRQEAQQGQSGDTPDQANQKKQPTLKFRNYEVQSTSIAHEKVQPARAPTYEGKKEEDTEGVQEDEQNVINVAPKKANWDLKRDVQKQLQILERRTNRALAVLLLQQMQAEQEQQKIQDSNGD